MDILRVKVNNEWVDIPALVGPQGERGPQGDTGPKGDPGDDLTAVHFNAPQNLTEAQKNTARSNIGAVNVNDYNPVAKTNAMTRQVGKDANGNLWTEPDIVVESLTVNQNGTITAPPGKAYSPVTVNVSGSGGGSSFPSLPSGYQRVEYISADGNQWAENRSGTMQAGKAIRIIMESASTSEACMLGYNGDNGTTFECYTSGSGCEASGYGDTPLVFYTDVSPTYSLLNKRQLAIWRVTSDCAAAWICQYCDYTSSRRYAYNGKIYRITVSDSFDIVWDAVGNTVFDFIPCYRLSDNAPGFYEVNTNEFYPSESGTPFGKGPDA